MRNIIWCIWWGVNFHPEENYAAHFAVNRAFLYIFEELLVLQNFFSCKINPRHCNNRF